MSAVLKQDEILIRPMAESDVADIMKIEKRAYNFPWTATIFCDCLRVGYCCWVLERNNNELAAYSVMSVAVSESHLLNITVNPDYHSQGLGRQLMQHMLEVAIEHDANMTFLEVRPSNFAAIKLYLDLGFDEIGVRRNYYPAKIGREDALILARNAVP